jgi:hypothetical protein
LAGAILDCADLRNATGFNTEGIASANGTIYPDGTIPTLNLMAGQNLLIGNGTPSVVITTNGTIGAGASITANGQVTGQVLTNNGSFTVASGVTALNQITGTGTITISGGTLQIAQHSPASSQSALTMSGSGSLDITDNTVSIDYGVGNPSPVSTIGGYIKSGYDGGFWNGPGIISSEVASVNAALGNPHAYAIGYADASDPAVAADHFTPGTVVIEPAIVGDANLDGKVNFADFQLLSASFNQPNTSWDQGNFNYGAKTNFADFQLLAANFNDSTTLDNAEFNAMNDFAKSFGDSLVPNADGVGFTIVPEPTAVGALGITCFGLLARRRRTVAQTPLLA